MSETRADTNEKSWARVFALASVLIAVVAPCLWLWPRVVTHAWQRALVGVITYLWFLVPVFSWIALFKIRRSACRVKGRGLAIAGLGIWVCGVFVACALTWSSMGSKHAAGMRLLCGTNLKGIGSAMAIYAHDNDDEFPTADRWCDILIEQTKVTAKQFVCRYNGGAIIGESSYALNRNIIGRKMAEVPRDTVLLFETNLGKERGRRRGYLSDRVWYEIRAKESPKWAQRHPAKQKVYEKRWNQIGGPENIAPENHGVKGCNVLFNRGNVRFVDVESLAKLNWAGTKD